MLTTSSLCIRLQARAPACDSRVCRPASSSRRMQQQPCRRPRILSPPAATATPSDADDRSTPEVPSDMAFGLQDQQSGKLEGGPADLRTDQDLESSDTNPDALDPSEQSKVADREGTTGSGAKEAQTQTEFASDASGQPSAQGTGGSADPSPGLDEPAGGDGDAQAAAMSADAGGSNAEITSDSVAERVAQEFGVGPKASPGAAEAESYRAEAGQEGGEDKGQSA